MSTDKRKYVGAQDTNHSIKLADEFFENVAKFEQWRTSQHIKIVCMKTLKGGEFQGMSASSHSVSKY